MLYLKKNKRNVPNKVCRNKTHTRVPHSFHPFLGLAFGFWTTKSSSPNTNGCLLDFRRMQPSLSRTHFTICKLLSSQAFKGADTTNLASLRLSCSTVTSRGTGRYFIVAMWQFLGKVSAVKTSVPRLARPLPQPNTTCWMTTLPPPSAVNFWSRPVHRPLIRQELKRKKT